MSKDPEGLRGAWWWIDRWRRSSAFMDFTLSQQGAYRNLLDEVWLRGGVLPDDERTLARASGDPLEWPDMRDRVMAKFYRAEGGWRHKTVDEVMSVAVDLRDKRAVSGLKGFEKVARGEKGRFTGKDGQTHGQTVGSPVTLPVVLNGQVTASPYSVLRTPSPLPSPEESSVQATDDGTPAAEPSAPTLPHDADAKPWRSRPEPLIDGRRSELELEWLALVREISERTGAGPEDVAPAYKGHRGVNPADLSPKRLLRDVVDLRERRAALEPKVPEPRRGDVPPEEAALHNRRKDLASELLAWYRLHPEAGEFGGRSGMHGAAFKAWPPGKALPEWVQAAVFREAHALLASMSPHAFKASVIRAKGDKAQLCDVCVRRQDDPLHGAA